MHLEDFLPPLEVRQFHRHPAVKAAGAGEGRVKGVGAVGGGEDDDPGVALEAVHFRQELVEGLLSFVIAANLAVTLLADSVNLVNEDNAGCLLLGLLEQVAHLGSAQAHEHLHELRAGHGEERHISFTCHRLSQEGLACAGRSHQQETLGHGGADGLEFFRVMEVGDNLGKIFLGLLLPGHIAELHPLGALDVDLGLGAAQAEHHGVPAAPHALHHLAGHVLADGKEDQEGQHPGQQEEKSAPDS